MRCISPHANYSITLFNPKPKRGMDGSGTIVEYTDGEPLLAQFDKTGLLDHEIEEALEYFDFSALPEGVNPVTRIACFDSEVFVMRFPEEEREAKLEAIDKRLREVAPLFPTQFRIVEQPPADKPWANYDEQSVDDILQLQAQTGISPEKIRLYELERKAPRSTLIRAMEELEAGVESTALAAA